MAFNGDAKKPSPRIVIVGGSVSALMCGIVLKNAGAQVHIIEQGADERESYMAGICLGPDAEDLLDKHDKIHTVFSRTMVQGKTVNKDGKTTWTLKGRRQMTNWLSLYLRLRANFDGHRSSQYPDPPQQNVEKGSAVYQSRTRVIDISQNSETGEINTKHQNLDNNDTFTLKADFVIGADGTNSIVRDKFLPGCVRQDTGYVAWRGTVPELEVSEKTRQIFENDVTLSVNKQHHNVMYLIPGDDGSLEEGKRMLNLLWYTNETPESMKALMTDSLDGHLHRNTVPSDRLRKDVWAERLNRAEEYPLSTPFLEVIRKISAPFVQRVTDYCATRAVFEDGKIILIGDALSLFRPHTAFSTNQAAFHALCVADYIQGRLDAKQLNDRLTKFSRLHWAQSLFMGSLYQKSKIVAIGAALRYLFYCLLDRISALITRTEPLLRSPMSQGKKK